MDLHTTTPRYRPSLFKSRRRPPETLNNDVLRIIFTFLDILDRVRCSAVCKSWQTIISEHNISKRLSNIQLENLAIGQQKSSLQEGPCEIHQWKGHSVGINKCRMKGGLILTGVGDKLMRLWSANSCKLLDEFSLPDKSPLIDYDFDETKVVGLVGTRICIWKRMGNRGIFSSREDLFVKARCMQYMDPHAVVGCEDGKAYVFDMYSRKISQIIKMHPGASSSISFTDDELIISGSSYGNIAISDLSSDQQVATMGGTRNAGIRTLCFNPRSNLVLAGSRDGYVSCWDLRMLRSLWEKRVSPNVIYAMNHLRSDSKTLVVGGIDGVLYIVDQENGKELSRCIMENISNLRKSGQFEKKKAVRISEDTRVDLLPTRRPISCLAVGMQKIVTIHNDTDIRVWKFSTK